jgi:DNA-binding MarR family transcriptional regulator
MSGDPVRDVVGALRAFGAEIDRLDDGACRLYGLNRTDMRALEIVSRAGPIAPTDLARLMGFTTGGITTVIDRLERAGYVVRRPAGADRRRLVIEVTETTLEKDQAVFGGLSEATDRFVASFKPAELASILQFLEGVRAVTAAYADSLADDNPTTETRPAD